MNDVVRLSIFSLIRTIVVIFILFYTNLPTLLKLVLAWPIADQLEFCQPNHGIFSHSKYNFYNSKNMCQHKFYNIYDKISDSITITLIIYYIYSNNLVNSKDLSIILFFYIYRIIGTIIYLLIRNRKVFLLFPDINSFLVLIIFTLKYFYKDYTDLLNFKYRYLVIILLLLFKFCQELIMHGISNNSRNKLRLFIKRVFRY
jgi:hypothetical protein